MATIKLLASPQTTNDRTIGRYYGVSRDGFYFGPHKNTWIPDQYCTFRRFYGSNFNFCRVFWIAFCDRRNTTAAFRKLTLVCDIGAQFRSLSCTTSSKIAIFSKFFNQSNNNSPINVNIELGVKSPGNSCIIFP